LQSQKLKRDLEDYLSQRFSLDLDLDQIQATIYKAIRLLYHVSKIINLKCLIKLLGQLFDVRRV
jgi:hypothetical protein